MSKEPTDYRISVNLLLFLIFVIIYSFIQYEPHVCHKVGSHLFIATFRNL